MLKRITIKIGNTSNVLDGSIPEKGELEGIEKNVYEGMPSNFFHSDIISKAPDTNTKDNINLTGSQGSAEPNPSAPVKFCDRELMDYFDECLNSKKYQAFTLTFREVIRRNWKEVEIQKLVNNTLKGWGFLYYPKLDWFLLPDVDGNGNFHYHGVIRITKEMMPKFKRNITSKLGFIKFKYIDNVQKWTDYCYKRGSYNDNNVYDECDIFALACYNKKFI